MAKPDPWRLNPNSYAVTIDIPPRYQDLDTLGHVNNVAFAALFETARVHFHHGFGSHPSDKGVRWLVAAVNLTYVAEAHFPHVISVKSAVGPVGNSSWTVLQAAFQDGVCVATCDSVIVSHGPAGKRRIDDETRAVMAKLAASPAE